MKIIFKTISVLLSLLISPAMATDYTEITERQVLQEDYTFDGVQIKDISNSATGGAILSNNKLIIKNSEIKNNTGGAAGALYDNSLTAFKKQTGNYSVSIDNSYFVYNTAGDFGAVAIFSPNSLVSNSQFAHNKATANYANLGDGAGALMLGSESQTVVYRVSFDSNESGTVGGAIATRPINYWLDTTYSGRGTNSSIGAKVDITYSQFFNNVAGTRGGAFFNSFYNSRAKEGYAYVSDSTFVSNRADKGGAVFVEGWTDSDGGNAKLWIDNSTFYKNTATHGGAIYNESELVIKDTRNYRNKGYVFKENSASESGGAIYNIGNVELNSVSFLENSASESGGAIYNTGTLVLSGTNEFSKNKAQNSANDIYNVGDLTIANGTTTIDGGVVGAGNLIINEGAVFNIGRAKINQNNITLNGTLIADLVADSDAFLIAAQSFEGNGKLNVVVEKAGTYNIFGNKVFANAQNQIISPVFDLNWSTDGKTFETSLKSADKIAEDTGVSKEIVNTVLNIASSDSEQLKDLSLRMQEKLATHSKTDIADVEHATKSVHPETESVVQSVATSVQTTVGNLAATRMALPAMGRSGGDIKPTGAGFWINGLYNYTKQKSAFDGDTHGFAIGMDGTFNKVFTVGTGYSYSRSDIDALYRDTEIDSYTMFVYGQYKPNKWYVNAVLNYTMSQYSEKGSALGIDVNAEYDIRSFGGRFATGYNMANGITPELGLRYTHIDADDYTNNLGIKNRLENTDYMTLTFGGKYARDFRTKYSHVFFTPEFHGLLKYDVMSDNQVAVVSMPGIDSYSISGEKLSKFGAELGIGLTMRYYNADWSLDYDLDIRKEYTSHTGRIKWRYNF